MHTTLNLIRSQCPCTDGWRKLLTYLNKSEADDEPLPLITILDSNGLDDAIWCLRATPNSDFKARMFAVFCARQVVHLNPDPRVKAAIDTAERFAHGEATQEELAAAAYATHAAAYATPAAAHAAYAAHAAAYAAYAAHAAAPAAQAAHAAAQAVAYAAYAAHAAAYAAYAAHAAAHAAQAATHAARAVQADHFRALFQS